MNQPSAVARDRIGPWSEPEPEWAEAGLRGRIRRLRAAEDRVLVALDDDPTGSQAVHGVQVVMVDDPDQFRAALGDRSRSCFVLTNSRSLAESPAVALTARVAGELFDLAAERETEIDLVSRSDSTLRGHIVAEVGALDAARRQARGRGYDAVLFAPAFLEAGRVTADDVHWARIGDSYVPVGSTEFARDATFGFTSSDLREHLVEVGRGKIDPAQVSSLSLHDIRVGGPDRVTQVLNDATDLQYVVVNALAYSDLEVVALGALRAAAQGKALLYRGGPSLVRALDGQEPIDPLSGDEIWGNGEHPAPEESGNGMVVVGSHVGQTSRQIEALQARSPLAEIVVDIPELLRLPDATARADYVAERAARAVDALQTGDVLVYTSRTLVSGSDGAASLDIARTVSDAVAGLVRLTLAARPAWIVAKGGITSHDVAMNGLGIRRAEVVGQMFPGVISVFRSLDADPRAIGRPYVVFAGNVGDVDSLADVVERLRTGRPDPHAPAGR